MGEISDGLINGDFDFYTGEYIGRGFGIPRTRDKSLPWEKSNNERSAYIGILNFLRRKGIFTKKEVKAIVDEYITDTDKHLKQKCSIIQQDFPKFTNWINKKLTNKTIQP